ncbi:hypothetical protein FACS189443_2720 [Planctomycetales bacterium]|nr:hypothetical protein FACS189443_2720 [Planctomycetales bacterium]
MLESASMKVLLLLLLTLLSFFPFGLFAQSDDRFTLIPEKPARSGTAVIPATPQAEPQPAGEQVRVRQAQVHVTGYLELSKRNHVVLAAPERAVLISLQTQLHDRNGNLVKSADGQPVFVPIVEGMHVFKGQVLGNFDDRELQSTLKIGTAQLEVAKAEREKKIEIKYAERGMQVAHAEVEMMREANKRHEGTFPKIDLVKSTYAFLQAEANYDLQKYTIEEVKTREVTVRENELDRTRVLIGLRKLIAPIDGMVVKIEHTEGEWLREGDVVLEIKQLNTLRFRGKVDARLYEINELEGRPATVYVTLASGKNEAFPGKVVFVDPQVDVGGVYHVYIDVQNKPSGNSWQLQPGRDDAEAIIQLNAVQ